VTENSAAVARNNAALDTATARVFSIPSGTIGSAARLSRATSPAAQANPQIILFIGGNLTGTSDGGFIDTVTGQSAGAERVDPGPLGGSAACLPRGSSGVAECVWADNDTFGVIASQTLSVTDLANELRTARPEIEHRK